MAEGPSAKRPPHCRLALLLTGGLSFVLVPTRRHIIKAAPALAAGGTLAVALPARQGLAAPHGMNRLREGVAELPPITFTDAEGQGSQGRSYDEDPSASACSSPPPPPPGVRTDPDGTLHVDLEA